MQTTCLLALLLLAVDPAQQTTGTIEHTVTETYSLNYIVQTPADFDPEGEPLPLVLFLHGAGERGDNLDKVKLHGPPKLAANGGDLPAAIIVSPQCPSDKWWNHYVPALVELLNKIEADYPVDKDHIYITGLSMGGYGTFALAAAIPDRVAAIVPICGGGERWQARALSTVPAWVFHGAADTVVDPYESQRMVKVMNMAGGEHAKLTLYEGVNHDSWTQTYNNPEVWDWLMSQRLSDRAEKQ